MDREELKEVLKSKLGLTEEVFDKEFEEALKAASGDEKRAVRILKAKYKGQLRSPAKMFKGVVIARRPIMDLVAPLRREAYLQAQIDRFKARESGYIDAHGNPLDTRQEIWGRPNPNFGKPLPEHDYIRSIYGVVEVEDEYKLFALTLRGDKVFLDIPLWKPVQFRANVARNQPDDGTLRLNQSTTTTFIPLDEELSIHEVLDSDLLSDYVYSLSDLKEAYTKQPPFVIVSAVVAGRTSEPNEYGNYFFNLDDDSLDIDADGVPCFVPVDALEGFDVQIGDEIIVTGRVNQNERDGQTRYVLNAWDIIPI